MEWASERILKAVEQWAVGRWWMIRETKAAVNGRIDALLVPVYFDAARANPAGGNWAMTFHLIGVEVKASRADFKRGLDEGQFDRYAESLPALYLATPPEIKTKEIPEGLGHLIVYRWDHCVCKRRPAFRKVPLTEPDCWRIIMKMAQEFRKAGRERDDRLKRAQEKVGERFGAIFAQMVTGKDGNN